MTEKFCCENKCAEKLFFFIKIFSLVVRNANDENIENNVRFLYGVASDQFAYIIKKNWSQDDIKAQINVFLEDFSQQKRIADELYKVLENSSQDAMIKD